MAIDLDVGSVKQNEGLGEGHRHRVNESKSPVAGFFQLVNNRNQAAAVKKWQEVVQAA